MEKEQLNIKDYSISMEELEELLVSIEGKKIQQTVFFGNGINLVSNPNVSWDNLLRSVSGCTFKYPPYTLQYEDTYVTCSKITYPKKSKEYNLKLCYLLPIKKIISNQLYGLLAGKKVNNFITTNYDVTLDKEFNALNYTRDTSVNTSEQVYSIRRLHRFIKDKVKKNVWYAHGEEKYPKSIMLGYDQYCGTIGLLNDYLKGNYKLPNGRILESMVMRIKKNDKEIHSWIDLFFFTDVHIFAFGLDYSEMDIWWILNRRKRMLVENKLSSLPNKIYFYMNDLDPEKAKLLKDFDVIVVRVNVSRNNYKSAYQRIINNI